MTLSRLLTCSLCLTAVVASAEEYWASGIYQSDGNYHGWYDVDKTGDDDGMCYAASAANLVAWWQFGRQNSGLSLPSGVPTAPEDIWGKYKSACEKTDEGGVTVCAINWWLSGVYLPATPDEEARSVVGYDEENVDLITLKSFSGYYYDQYSLTEDDLGDFFKMYALDPEDEEEKELYAGVFADLLTNGAGVSLGLSSDKGELAHAVTLWGAEYDDVTGVLSMIWLTDSDDNNHQLFSVDVNVDEDANKIYFKDPEKVGYGYYEGVYIDQVRAILPSVAEAWGIPEPNAATLAALMSLVGVATRRRRRK